MILSFCDTPSVMEVVRIVQIVIDIIKVVVPIILIVSAMIDLVRAVTDSELNKISKPMVNKVIAAVVIFLILTIVGVMISAIGGNSEYKVCLEPITKEQVRQAHINYEENLVKKAESSLKLSDYNSAMSYIINIKDYDERKMFEDRLKTVKEKIDSTHVIKPGPGQITFATDEYEQYRTKAIDILHSDKVVSDAEIEAAAAKVGMTKSEFIDAVEWAACENGHLMAPNLYCNGDMELAAAITYLNISGAINILNLDSGCHHNRNEHMSKHEHRNLADYQNRYKDAISKFRGEYYNTYMRFAVEVANDLAPVYMWPPHADVVVPAGYVNKKLYYSYPYYMPPFDPFGTHDGFVTLRSGQEATSPILNPYDVVKYKKEGLYMWN